MEHTQKNGKVWRSRFLRVSLIVMACVMLLCGSYLVTYAMMNAQATGQAVNTFKQTTTLATNLYIVEQIPTDTATNGVRNGILDETPSGTEVTGATYLYAPGVTLKKRVYVKIENLQEDAYLFVTATTSGAWSDTGLSWALDTNNWISFTENNQTVYVYKTKLLRGQSYNWDGESYNMNGEKIDFDIIQNDEVHVHHDIYNIQTTDTSQVSDLQFKAYLVQAMGISADGDTPAYVVAWRATYGASTN